MSRKSMKWIGGIILVWFVSAAVGPCTITHKFGPYFGKVVDETGQPIEGALVLKAFYTIRLGGLTHNFVEALETVTDRNGEFHLAPYRAWVFRFPDQWDPIESISIFKPGYRVYSMRYIRSNEYLTIEIPRLRTREDQIKNLREMIYPNIPREKLKNFFEFEKKARREIGLTQ